MGFRFFHFAGFFICRAFHFFSTIGLSCFLILLRTLEEDLIGDNGDADGDAVAVPDNHSASVFGRVASHPPLLRFAPHVVEDDIDAVRIDEVGFHDKQKIL